MRRHLALVLHRCTLVPAFVTSSSAIFYTTQAGQLHLVGGGLAPAPRNALDDTPSPEVQSVSLGVVPVPQVFLRVDAKRDDQDVMEMPLTRKAVLSLNTSAGGLRMRPL